MKQHAGSVLEPSIISREISRLIRGRAARSFAATVVLAAGAAAPVQAKFDVPTGADPSPLFGARPFEQKLLMFEEFGTEPLPAAAQAHTMPSPGGCGPATSDAYNKALDQFLDEPLYPAPRRMANTDAPNAWAAAISGCLGRSVVGAIEGRPPGENFAHQRWDEFPPQVYFQTAQAGSRPNGGLRDKRQLHGYGIGEFGPGGLYHNTVGAFTANKLGLPVNALDGTTKGIAIRFHPSMPVQSPEKLWTFDGTLPPKLLMAPYGTPILNRHYNALPISDAANGGFGKHTITTHEHNGHNPAESDGFAGAFFYPGQYYDYRWPMVLAGHDTVNKAATDPRAGTPLCQDPRPGRCDQPGGIRNIPGDWREMASTHWFHDHMLDYTAQNVYKGNATMMNIYSSVDRGREPANEAEAQGNPATPGYGCHYADPNNVNLCLPSGSGLDWGNRDYDINLVYADKAFDRDGQLFFNVFNTDGFVGDVATVNFLYKPYLDVRARRYRFRMLNGSVSRNWKVALVDAAGNQVPFHMVGNDGNIMEHAVPFPSVQSPEGLPEQAIAERWDIVVDFSNYEGQTLYFVNLMEHENGKGPKQAIPLRDVLSGAYSKDGCPKSCDPVVGKFMELRVHAHNGVDLSMDPAQYVEGKKKMVPLPGFTPEELANAKERTFEFGRSGDDAPWTIKTDGGLAYGATGPDGMLDRISAAPERDSVEIWHIRNGGNGWSHPVHIHFEEGQILQRGGKAPPLWEKGARKDVYRIGPLVDSTDSVDVAIRVREFLGTYVEHCHNTQHEDHAMLMRWDSRNPGQTLAIQTPYPSWDGVVYYDSNTTDVPTFETGMGTDFLSTVAAPLAKNDAASTSVLHVVQIPVLANDTCVGACDPKSIAITPAGAAVANGDGTVTYTAPAAAGTYSFSYTVRDTTAGKQASNAATVTVAVGAAPAPAAPVAVADGASTLERQMVGIAVSANDQNCAAGCTVAIVGQPANGTAQANAPGAGQVIYTPSAGFTGTDTFSYTATNAGGTSAAAVVTVEVTPNPVVATDEVTISGVRLVRGGFSVGGGVSRYNGAYAGWVEVFAPGVSTGSACSGTSLGKAAVKSSSGGWSFSAKGVTADRVCVKSENGGVADRAM